MTDLAAIQEAFTRVCFDLDPREEDLARLHAPRERWLMYRDMVRSRLFSMIENGLPRSAEVLGQARFEDAIARYLAEHGPRTRFIREVVHELVRFAIPIWQTDPSTPAHAIDLVRFEDAKWRVASLPMPTIDVDPFDFERVAVFNPTLEVVRVSYRVDKDALDPTAQECELLVFRKPELTNTWTYAVRETGARLVRAWRSGLSCAEGARSVLAELGREADPKFVDELATVLAELVEQKMILGSRR